MNGIQLNIPSLSQHNATHDAYFDKDGFNRDLVERHGVIVYPGSSVSDGWCGWASASMIYNDFKQVQQYAQQLYEPLDRARCEIRALSEEVWSQRGARYWLKASRLLEAQQLTSNTMGLPGRLYPHEESSTHDGAPKHASGNLTRFQPEACF